MPDYNTIGFDNNLSREFPLTSSSNRPSLSEDDFASLVEGVSGSKITSGIIRSKDGTILINLDTTKIQLLEGALPVLEIGKFDDGSKGIRVVRGRGHQVSLEYLELGMGVSTIVGGAVNTARLYVDRGGNGGKNRLQVQFNSGPVRTLAIQG